MIIIIWISCCSNYFFFFYFFFFMRIFDSLRSKIAARPLAKFKSHLLLPVLHALFDTGYFFYFFYPCGTPQSNQTCHFGVGVLLFSQLVRGSLLCAILCGDGKCSSLKREQDIHYHYLPMTIHILHDHCLISCV